MITVGELFLKHSTVASTGELCSKLAQLLEKEQESCSETKCTKKLYTSIVKHLDSAVANGEHERLDMLFKALSCLAKTSTDEANGFHKLITFGLPQEHILSWYEDLFGSSHGDSSHGDNWSQLVDNALFSLTEILSHLTEEDRREMVCLLPLLLKCVCNRSLPSSAQIEAARGSNFLIEACTDVYKSSFTKKSEIKALIHRMGKSIQSAGNFELQVSVVECLYRLTTDSERVSLAHEWFSGQSTLVEKFTAIRETEFEVDCRMFLNELNSCSKERSVYSLSCTRLFCGNYELHCPQDESVTCFWVDFNTGSSSVTVYVDDPLESDGETQDNVWEMVTIREAVVNNWTVKAQDGGFSLVVTLKAPAHSLLPSIPPSSSHTVTIKFNSACDPSQPSRLALGASKQAATAKPAPKPATVKTVKQSSTINCIPINQKRVSKRADSVEISPIEVPPDTPVQGGQVDSQESNATPAGNKIPLSTPVTSTPKPSYPKQLGGGSVNPPPSSGRRPPLAFVSNGTETTPRKELAKASMAVNSIVLNSMSKISQQKSGQKSATGSERGAPKKTPIVAQLRALPSPHDADSPVFDYKPTVAVLETRQPQTKSTMGNNEPKKQAERTISAEPKRKKPVSKSPVNSPTDSSPLTSPVSVLSNGSSSGKHRKFNLSGVSQAHSKKSQSKGRTSKSKSKYVSPNSTCTSDIIEPSAIPDSFPAQPLKAPAKKLATKKPAAKKPATAAAAKSRAKPVPVKRSRRSFACESDDDNLDQSWEPTRMAQEKNKSKVNATKEVTARKIATGKKRNDNVTTKSEATKPVAKPVAMTFQSQIEKQQFMDEVYGDFSTPDKKLTTRKRVIDSVYDLNDANFEAPPTKVSKTTAVAQAKTVQQNQPPKRSSKTKPKSPPKTKRRKVGNNLKDPKTVRKPLTEVSNHPSQNIKPYGNKNYQKQLEVDDNAFDDLVSNYRRSKRHCPEQDVPTEHVALSPIKSPEETPPRVSKKRKTPAKKLPRVPVTLVASPSKISNSREQHSSSSYREEHLPSNSHEQHSPSSSESDEIEELSVAESLKDQMMNTDTTETAQVPLPPPAQDPLNIPPSPSASVQSSQITADFNITSGFHEICRALISKSGAGMDALPQQVATTSFQAQSFPDDCVEEVDSTLSNTCTDPEYEESDQLTVTLTQLTRDMMSRHQVEPRDHVMGAKKRKKQPPQPPVKVLKKQAFNKPSRAVLPTPRGISLSQGSDAVSGDDETLSAPDSPSSVTYSNTNTRASAIHSSSPVTLSLMEEEDIEQSRHSSNLQDLENLFRDKLPTTSWVKPTSKKAKGDVLQVWQRYQGERGDTLSLYRDQLYKEMESLERDVQRTQDTEKQTIHFMRKRLTTLQQSIGSQQKKVGRIRTLQVSFHQHLGTLDKTQSSEQQGAHKTLKQEIHSLQKKLLVDYERKEVSRVKQSLHAMLLQVL